MSVKTRSVKSGYKLQKVPTVKYGYTLLVYKKDRRVKGGEKLVNTYDYDGFSGNAMMDEIKCLHGSVYPRAKYRLDFVETWVTRKNAMTGETFQERYDTPYYCSPSSDSYWSN